VTRIIGVPGIMNYKVCGRPGVVITIGLLISL